MTNHMNAAIEAGAKAIFDEDSVRETENNPTGTPIKWPNWDALCECNLRGPGADCICGRVDFEGTKYEYLRGAEEALNAMLPHLRAMIAEEIRDFGEHSGIGAYGDYGPPAIAVSDAVAVVEGECNEGT